MAQNPLKKKNEILAFLTNNIFQPILDSPSSSTELKQGVRYTIMRIEQLDAEGIIHYYWSAIVGTERSTEFARKMRSEGFVRFEEVIDEFRDRFSDSWLRS